MPGPVCSDGESAGEPEALACKLEKTRLASRGHGAVSVVTVYCDPAWFKLDSDSGSEIVLGLESRLTETAAPRPPRPVPRRA
jgi:hypothetical protein